MATSRFLYISGPALRDLSSIGDYTSREWGERQKEKYLGGIKEKFLGLRDNPDLGTPRDDLGKGLRSRLFGRHVIYYREAETRLTIVRILHRSMEPERHMDSDT